MVSENCLVVLEKPQNWTWCQNWTPHFSYPQKLSTAPTLFFLITPHSVSPVYRNGLGVGAFPGEGPQPGEGGRVRPCSSGRWGRGGTGHTGQRGREGAGWGPPVTQPLSVSPQAWEGA